MQRDGRIHERLIGLSLRREHTKTPARHQDVLKQILLQEGQRGPFRNEKRNLSELFVRV